LTVKVRDVHETVADTPVGAIRALSSKGCVHALEFEEGWRTRKASRMRELDVVQIASGPDPRVEAALRAYLAGDLAALDDLDATQPGGEFHQRVWRALREIPAGKTETYGGLSRRLGLDNGARAVGHAAAVNRIALIVPCHRLVGARGALTGFAYGIERKRWLLEHEGALAKQAELAAEAMP